MSFTDKAKSTQTGSQSEVDFLFSDLTDFLFADGLDFVFRESSVVSLWSDKVRD